MFWLSLCFQNWFYIRWQARYQRRKTGTIISICRVFYANSIKHRMAAPIRCYFSMLHYSPDVHDVKQHFPYLFILSIHSEEVSHDKSSDDLMFRVASHEKEMPYQINWCADCLLHIVSNTRQRSIYRCALYVFWVENHYNDVIMGAIASEITSLAIVYSTVYSGWDKK